ncbi:MAG: methyltransferase domain-containing protein [Alistipes sp.]
MMTITEYTQLLSAEVQQAIAENLGRNPLEVALDSRIVQRQLVATQVKYLTRARAKLPTYAAAQCVLPPLAFEQASSEECADRKSISGEAVLDLTCGLGVDALALSKRFRRVVALERDEVLARITADNLHRLGVRNVEVICAAAEDFLRATAEHFDWVYADPDRRDAAGHKRVRLEECSPNVLALMPEIERVSGRLCLKNSPLFDVDEAFRLFGTCRVEVVSLGDECKEVVIYADHTESTLSAVAVGRGERTYPLAEVNNSPCTTAFEPEKYHWLILPDVALQKARLSCQSLRGVADIWSNNGYGFACEPVDEVLGRVFAIERIEAYNPKELKRSLRGHKVEVLKHDFPLSTARIVTQLGIKEGGDERIAFTKIDNRFWAIRLK